MNSVFKTMKTSQVELWGRLCGTRLLPACTETVHLPLELVLLSVPTPASNLPQKLFNLPLCLGVLYDVRTYALA